MQFSAVCAVGDGTPNPCMIHGSTVNGFKLGKAGSGHMYQKPFKMSIACNVVISFLGIYPVEQIRAMIFFKKSFNKC